MIRREFGESGILPLQEVSCKSMLGSSYAASVLDRLVSSVLFKCLSVLIRAFSLELSPTAKVTVVLSQPDRCW